MTDHEPPPPSAWEPATLDAVDTAKPDVSRQRQAIAVLALVLAIVIVALATSPFWAPGVAPLLPWGEQPTSAAPDRGADVIHELQTRLDADEAALRQQAARLSRLDQLELALKDQATRLSTVEARPETPPAPVSQPPAPPAQSAETAAEIKTLRDQVARLTTQTGDAGDRLAKLEHRVDQAGTARRADRALLLALANLRIAVEGSAPFTAELAAAQSLADDDAKAKQDFASLGEAAKSGLPGLAQLTEQFDRRVAPATLRARGEAKDQGWWRQIEARLERLVVIRRIAPGGVEPRNATEGAVARADAALRSGDLAGAVAALDPLAGTPAGDAAAPWLATAKKRVAAEAALAALWRRESERVAAASRGDKP